MHISGRYHNADDIVATVLAIEPIRFVYRGRCRQYPDDLTHTYFLFLDQTKICERNCNIFLRRIAVFGIPVLRDEKLVVIVEQKPDCEEQLCFKWMSSVIQVTLTAVVFWNNRCFPLGVKNALSWKTMKYIENTKMTYIHFTLHTYILSYITSLRLEICYNIFHV